MAVMLESPAGTWGLADVARHVMWNRVREGVRRERDACAQGGTRLSTCPPCHVMPLNSSNEGL